MSDAVDYLHAYAERAICRARRMPVWQVKASSKSGWTNLSAFDQGSGRRAEQRYLEDFRAARRLEKSIAPERAQALSVLGKTPPPDA